MERYLLRDLSLLQIWLTGELFLESPKEIDRLNTTFENLRTLSLSPADSMRLITERRKQHG